MADKNTKKLNKLPRGIKKPTLFHTVQVKLAGGANKKTFKPPSQVFRTQHKG